MLYLDTIAPKQTILLSLGSYKSAGFILACLQSYHTVYISISESGHHSVFTPYSYPFLLTAIIMSFAQNSQVLHYSNIPPRPDYYKTILPNLSYPSRHNVHIPWSGSSAPLPLWVRLCFLFLPVDLPLSLRRPHSQRWQSSMVKLAIPFLDPNYDTKLKR